MKEFFDQVFERPARDFKGALDLHFNRCTFQHCRLWGVEDPAKRPLIQRVILRDCRIADCGIQRAIIEDSCVDTIFMRNGDLFMIWGCLFNRLILRGRFGNININEPYTSAGRTDEQLQRRFDEADEQYYKNVDWAIDIRDAEVISLRIRGVPAHLIRRDPVTQAVITRQQVIEKKWDSIDLGNSWWKPILGAAARHPGGDIVLVAPKLHESFEVQVEGIRRLRLAGIAVSD